MRKRRRCLLLMGLVMFCFFTIYFPILWSIRPEDVEVWNTTRNMHVLVRPFNVTTVLANEDACRRHPQRSSILASGSDFAASSDDDEQVEAENDESAMEDEGVFLLVAVCSSVANLEARKAIRETWGREGTVFPAASASGGVSVDAVKPSSRSGTKHMATSGIASREASATSGATDGSNRGISSLPLVNSAFIPSNTNLDLGVGLQNFSTMTASGLYLKTNATVRVIFMLGRTPNATLQRLVELENEEYGDMVQEDFADTYNNLTLKSVMLLKWVNSSCRRVRYIMKTDDDTFVNVPRLVQYLRRHGRPNLLLGCLICQARPVKNKRSKWYAPRVLFNERVYPSYLSGTGYVMSADLVPRLYRTALDTPFFHLEDIFVTGLCARRLHVRPVDYEGFTYQQRSRDPCLYHFGITGHRVSPADTRAIWREMWAPDLRCDRSKIRLRSFHAVKCR